MGTSRKPDERDRQRGRELSRLRRARRITQADLAQDLGISMQQLGKYERGQNRMPISRYEQALAILNGEPARPTEFEEAQRSFVSQSSLKAELGQLLDRIAHDLARCRELARRL